MKYIILSLLLLFTACTTYDTGAKVVVEIKSQIDIRKTKASLYGLCVDASVGSIREVFGNNMSDYNGICNTYHNLKFKE